jgi:PAS domain S-box-containing protein
MLLRVATRFGNGKGLRGNMPHRLQSSGGRYGLAVLITATAFLIYLHAGMPDLDSDVRYFGFAIAVLLSSVTAGLGPGLFATGLASLASAYFLLAPRFSFSIDSEERAIGLLLFMGEAVLLSILGNRVRDAGSDDALLPGMSRYAAAVLLVLAATGLKLLGWHDVENHLPFAVYYAATATAAWTGGLGPGLLATLLASVCARYFFMEPLYSLSVRSPVLAARELVFIAEGMALSFLCARSARRFAGRVIEQVRQQGERWWRGEESARALRAISRDAVWEWELPSPTAQLSESNDSETMGDSADFHLWFQRVHPMDRMRVLASLTAAMEGGQSEWSCEYRRSKPGEGYVPVADHAFIIRDDAWKPVRVVGRSADMTSAYGVPSKFEHEGAYRFLFENNPHAMLLADGGLSIVDANDAACDVLGYSREALKRLDLEAVLLGSAREKLLELRSKDPASLTFEEECMRESGEVFRAKINAVIVSGIEKSPADRIITLEETADAGTNR